MLQLNASLKIWSLNCIFGSNVVAVATGCVYIYHIVAALFIL